MKKSRFTEFQVLSILKASDARRPVIEVWHAIRSAISYEGKAKYLPLGASE